MSTASSRLLRPLITALAAASLLPAGAHAASYEQVTRATGLNGLADPALQNSARAVGDSGRYAGFETFRNYNEGPKGFVRDIQTNTTWQPAGPGTRHIWGFDRAETMVLAERNVNNVLELVVVPLAGGPERVVYRDATPSSDLWGRFLDGAAISGDGSTVVVANFTDIRKITVATGVTKVLEQAKAPDSQWTWQVGTHAISDDGSTVVLNRSSHNGDADAGKVYKNGTVRPFPGRPIISADGSTIAYIAQTAPEQITPTTLVVRKLAQAQGQAFALPIAAGAASWFTIAPHWISADGGRVAVGTSAFSGGADPLPEAQQVTVSTGGWSTFGGRFASSIRGNAGAWPLVGPSGRYALLPVGAQIGLVDLSGGTLAGGGDAWSADVFIETSGYYSCKGSQSTTWPYLWGVKYSVRRRVKLRQPVSWIPLPKSAGVRISIDGLQVAAGTIALGQTLYGGREIISSSTRSDVTVTDGLGRVRSTSLARKIRCGEDGIDTPFQPV